MGYSFSRMREVLGGIMPGLGAVGGPCLRPVAGEPPDEGLLLPLPEIKNSTKLTHIPKHLK